MIVFILNKDEKFLCQKIINYLFIFLSHFNFIIYLN